METLFMEIVKGIFTLVYDAFQHLYFTTFIRPRIIPLLIRYNSYYRRLTKNKALFERKVWDFMRQNNFITRENVKLTLILKTIIASHAAQLSLYLPDEAYDYYDKIIIYKDYYLSRISQKYHKAEVNPGLKVIVFSVRAIHESLAEDHDGTNVLLHEFAHALWLEQKLMGHQYTIFEGLAFAQVLLAIKEELLHIERNEKHFFRNYAFLNEAEFFAVAIENFFERPEKFKQPCHCSIRSLFD
jgi:Mlc titration factor MtfA (ptsG expression regulator)